MKIRFIEDRNVTNEKGEVTFSFKKDEIHELPDASANHWITRRAAVLYEDPADKGKAPSTKVGMAKTTDKPAKAGTLDQPLPPPGSNEPDAMKTTDINKPAGPPKT